VNPIKIIGLAGPLESGKDTVAEILKGYGYIQLSYGSHIRAEAGAGWVPQTWVPNDILQTMHMLKDRPDIRRLVWAKPTTPEIRKLLQWWGEWRFSQNGYYWTRLLAAELFSLPQGKGRIVISDVRRPVEYNMIKSLHGENWKIERVVDENPFRHHPTETALRNHVFDAEIDNGQDLIRLRDSVDVCLKAYEWGKEDHR